MENNVLTKRISLIDSLRGFALLGILLVNIHFFNTSLQTISLGVELWDGTANKLVEMLQTVFINGKFILIFSFLFGLGMILLQESSRARGVRFVPLYIRRLSALLIVGLLHGVIIWYGDVLTHYSILGLLLLLFARCKSRTILVWAVLLLLLLPVLILGISFISPADSSFTAMSPEEIYQTGLFFQERDTMIYGQGTYTQITVQRLNDFIASVFNMLMFYPQILGMFLLGAYFGKRKLLHNIRENRSAFVKLMAIGAPIGLGLQLIMLIPANLPLWSEALILFVGAPLLALAYISLFALLYEREGGKRLLHAFSYPGKMAFTNYLCQSILCGFMFYGYGLGWFGRVEPVGLLVLGIGIFVVQMLCSKMWLRRFSIGPLEYAWRAFTYWRRPVQRSNNHRKAIKM